MLKNLTASLVAWLDAVQHISFVFTGDFGREGKPPLDNLIFLFYYLIMCKYFFNYLLMLFSFFCKFI